MCYIDVFMPFMDDCMAHRLWQKLIYIVLLLFIPLNPLLLFFLYRLQGKSQIVQDELVRLGESMVTSSEGTRALALELCREFEDKFLQHIMTGEVRHRIKKK